MSVTPRITVSEVGKRLKEERDGHRRRWIRRLVIAIACVAGLTLVSFFLLAYADYEVAANGSPRARMQWAWAHGDHLHFAVHIAQARLFDLCPCTRRKAAEQYWRAHFHAVTPWQRAVAADSHPQSGSQWVIYFAGPFAIGVDWLHDGATWLAVQGQSRQVTVDMADYEFQPDEITIARGTTVTWRNTDELGEEHSVETDPGQLVSFDSDVLEPDDSFAYTFTERGRFAYFCNLHGEPGRQGMSGVIVVQ